MRRYYKGTDIPFRMSIKDKGGVIIPLASFDYLEVIFRTSGEQYTKYYKGGGITENEDGTYRIYANENAFGLLPDGLLKYTVKYTINGNHDEIKECETDIIIKTPKQFQPKANVQDKSITVTENNSVSKVIPDGGYEGLGEVTVNVEIPFPLEVKTVSITENESTTTITIGDGYSGMSEVNVNVKVPITIKVGESGIKLSNSTFTEVPQVFDFSDATDLMSMFDNCTSLAIAPEMNTSEATNMTSLFTNCHSLTTVPSMDTSQVTTMFQMFANCYLLTSVPEMNTSNVTDMYRMFFECRSLTTVPSMDTSKVTNMGEMFDGCRKLSSIPPMDTSNVTNMSWLFYFCKKLTSIPPIDTSNVTNMYGMFQDCDELTSVPEMNTSNVTNMWYMFSWCGKIADLGGFVGLKCDLDLSSSSLITHNSLMNIINKAADVTASPATLTLGSTNLTKLTDEEKAIATSKGWTLA